MNLLFDTLIIFGENIAELKSFYSKQLGLKIIEDQPNWVLLDTGKTKIGLHKFGKTTDLTNNTAAGTNNNMKLVFEVFEDINNIRKKLYQNGVNIEELTTFDNYAYWICKGKDPEGNVFQLKQKKIRSEV